MADRISVKMDYEIEHQGQVYRTLSCRRPLVADLIIAERQPGEIGREAALLARCADVDMAVVTAMHARDYYRVVDELGSGFLLGVGPEADPENTSSPSTRSPDGGSPSS